jgi:hypothetical protein
MVVMVSMAVTIATMVMTVPIVAVVMVVAVGRQDYRDASSFVVVR